MALVEVRAGEERDDAVAARFVGVLLRALRDLAEQPGEHAAVHGGVVVLRLFRRAVLDDVGELPVDVAPLAHPGNGEEVRFAKPPHRIAAAASFRVGRFVPNVEEREEVGVHIGERAMGGSGGFFLLLGPLARVGHAEPGGDDE